jgi:tRNA U34 5-methylaminomethyl-2-thiouridine-forming methyltransferase MnmC
MHVFIKSGLQFMGRTELKILEIGFGTGLNALLTHLEMNRKGTVFYHGIELFPLEWEIIKQLNYAQYLGNKEECGKIHRLMHSVPWEISNEISAGFHLHKTKCSLTDIELTDVYNLIYFDAFAPLVQPELWTEKIFIQMFNCLSKEGVLVTYCAKGEVRRRMQRAGFLVERLPGPPGKREILRARKT